MTVETGLLGLFEQMQRDHGRSPQQPLKGGGGDGTSGNMEARVARLESDMEHVKETLKSLDGRVEKMREDVSSIKQDIGVIKSEISHLPGLGTLYKIAAGIVASAGALMAMAVRFIPHAG